MKIAANLFHFPLPLLPHDYLEMLRPFVTFRSSANQDSKSDQGSSLSAGHGWRALKLLSVGVLATTVGCWTNVAYEPPADGEMESNQTDVTEAPAADNAEGMAAETSETETFEADNQPAVAPAASGPVAEPADEPTAATAPATPPTSSLWDKKPVAAPSNEASKFFGGNQDFTAQALAKEATASQKGEEEANDFGDDLLSAYEGLEIGDSTIADPNTNETTPPEENTTPTQPTYTPNVATDRYDYVANNGLKIPELTRHPKKPTKQPAETTPIENEEDDLFTFEPTEEVAVTTPEPEAPVVDEPATDNSQPWEVAAETEPTTEDRYADIEPFETAATEPEITAPPVVEEPTTNLLPPPKPPSMVAPESPRLASINPLPSVPVLRYNTRHLAWLLGGKLGLARLAELEGATPYEVSQWIDETERLATQLKVTIPPASPSNAAAGRQVIDLFQAAAEASSSMADEQGPDHAALLEISLKTNALLVLCKKYPELAAPTARAVEAAAERAELPGFLWRKMTNTLLEDSSPDEIYKAVTQMHDNVESYLR